MAEQSRSKEMTFQDFTLMMTTSALIGLGEIPNPLTNQYEINLESVTQTISVLTMIRDKTKGNLTQEEEDLLESCLHNLRMAYVAKVREGPTKPSEPPEEEKPSRIILP